MCFESGSGLDPDAWEGRPKNYLKIRKSAEFVALEEL
jgi:hypothetical protein